MQAALKYSELGFSVIPVKQNKRPYIEWTEFQHRRAGKPEIEAWWKEWPDANVAIVAGIQSGVDIIDADTEEARNSIQEFLPDSLSVPTVKTPKGWHYYFLHKGGLTNKARVLASCDIRTQGGYVLAPPSTNGKAVYAWLPGLKITDVEVSPIPDMLWDVLVQQCGEASSYSNNALVLDTSTKGESSNVVKRRQTSSRIFEDGRRDNDLFHTANCLVKGGMEHSNISQVLEIVASSWGEGDDKKWLEAKVSSALKRSEGKDRNIAQEVKEFVLSSNGVFLSSEVVNFLGLSSNVVIKKNVSRVLCRLVDEGIIERTGTRNGQFRKVETDAPEIDIFSADSGDIKIQYPLNLHDHFKTLPKNIIVIAGTQDAGKTAFLMNFALMNLRLGIPIRYMSSEMGPAEFRARAEKFERPLSDWKPIEIREVSSNFQDYILPEGINLIDYLELSDAFYKVGGDLKEIYDRLTTGIAVVALQKDFKAELGRGGSFGLEKPRLYITFTANPPEGSTAKIVKCKNWANPDSNPNGKQVQFKLRRGCDFWQVGEWGYKKKETNND